MAPWHQTPAYLAWDTETTGVQVETDRIVTACTALIRLTEPDPAHRVQVRSWLIDPGVDIPAEATAIHGITSEFAKLNGDPPDGALNLIAAELALGLNAGIPIVGCNLAYDLTILDRELRRNRLPTLHERLDGRPLAPVIDVYVLDKALDPFRPGKRKLTNLCEHYGVRIDGAHDSTADALAAARIAYRIGQYAQMDTGNLAALYADRRKPEEVARAFQQAGRMTLAQLHDAQVTWRWDQQESLARYFEGKAVLHDGNGDSHTAVEFYEKAKSVDRHWPMRPFAPAPADVQEVLTP